MNLSQKIASALVLGCYSLTSTAAEKSTTPSTEQSILENSIIYQLKSLPAPFKLTDEEQADVTKVLEQWEHHSTKFENYSCKYTCWAYDEIWQREETCDGDFHIDKNRRYSISDNGFHSLKDKKKSPQLTRWVFDGESVIEYDESRKVVSRNSFASEPNRVIRFPFVLQANTKELAEQYYIRITGRDKVRHEIFLQFYPRTKAITGWFGGIELKQFSSRSDWRSFDHVDLILSDETYIPLAMQLHVSQHSRISYLANNPIVNAEDTSDWFKVETPEGWRETKLPLFAEQKSTAGD